MCKHMYIYICIYIYIHIDMHMHVHIHTHMHTCIYVYMYILPKPDIPGTDIRLRGASRPASGLKSGDCLSSPMSHALESDKEAFKRGG